MKVTGKKHRLRWLGATIAAAALAASTIQVGPAGAAPGKGGPGGGGGSGSAAPDCGAELLKSDGSAWRCTFADEFDGRALDGTKWLVQDTSYSGFTMDGTCFVDDGRHVRVQRGMLHLTVTKEAPFTCKSPFGNFTSEYKGADISGWGRFSQTYGRFEARLAFPDATTGGLHGGFWMNPQVKTYGGWPNSGEIDVAEWWSSRHDHVIPSLHYPGRDFWKDTGWWCSVGDPTKFHTYAVEWDKTVMRFYYDGRLCYTRSWEPSAPLVAPQPFDHPFYLSLSHAAEVGAMHADTRFPATILVDYAKAWS